MSNILIIFGLCFLTLFLLCIIHAKRTAELLRTRYQYRPLFAQYQRETGLIHPEVLELQQLPGFLIILILLHEDDRFFIHKGFNLPEIKRNIIAWIFKGKRLQGGSSITQQLVKNIFLIRKGLVSRKILEAFYGIILELTHSKVEILSLYLHSIRLGGNHIFGLHEASWYYFDKKPHELTLVEALFLFGIIPRPAISEHRILFERNAAAFRFINAHSKIVDFLRVMYKESKIWGLQDIHLLSYQRAIAIMKQYNSFRHDAFLKDEQAAFEVRAAIILDELNTLLEFLPSRVPSFAPRLKKSTPLHKVAI